MLLTLVIAGLVSLSFALAFCRSFLLFGVLALGFSLLISVFAGLVFSSWVGMVIAVVYVSGLMVLFSYFLAICPNQRFWFPKWIVIVP